MTRFLFVLWPTRELPKLKFWGSVRLTPSKLFSMGIAWLFPRKAEIFPHADLVFRTPKRKKKEMSPISSEGIRNKSVIHDVFGLIVTLIAKTSPHLQNDLVFLGYSTREQVPFIKYCWPNNHIRITWNWNGSFKHWHHFSIGNFWSSNPKLSLVI